MDTKKKYHLSMSVRDGIVEIVATGEITKNDLDALRAEVLKSVRENNAKAILWDSRAAKGPKDITGAYYRARSVPSDARILPCAIVELRENKDFQSFYETTAYNAGQSMKYFSDIESARAWLKSFLV
jgi:hypothetical protein